jgi:hypothetical protein
MRRTPVDYTQRNESFAPANSLPVQKEMTKAESVQSRVVEKQVNERKMLDAPSARRSGIEVNEAKEKNVVEKDVRQPEKIERQISAYNQKPAAITTAGDTTKPPTVAKFQDSTRRPPAPRTWRVFPRWTGRRSEDQPFRVPQKRE